ncbi:MAG: peptidase T [Anaerolineaceae bacterium]|jgi:tripeptide aminopeptidase|nr:peptidase T [Anaerolineaceae bacterium]
MTDVLERFLRYVKIDTQSAKNSATYPSTLKQLDLSRMLVDELHELNLEDVRLDEFGYVTATLPSNVTQPTPTIGFIAHVDTSPAASGKDVKPRLVENYDGDDIVLNQEQSIYLSPADSPDLTRHIGETLVVTDGTTLLGADDKAGVAAIMSAMATLMAHPEIPHGKIRVGFTPDEEVGAGVDHFDVSAFAADFAFTMDGGKVGELAYENFNAAGAEITIHGKSFHPGDAKGKLVNALQVAIDFHNLLPVFDRPEHTEKREGFFHLVGLQGEAEQAKLEYIIRDHDRQLFEEKKTLMKLAADYINQRYGAGTLELHLKDQYYNMLEKVSPHPEILDLARKAYRAIGVEPEEVAVRGGTDGSRLSFMGLPTPNLFTGGYNYHGRFEYLSVEELKLASQVIVEIARLATEGL